MIFLLAGTSDARALAVRLKNAGYEVLASVVTESAAASLRAEGLTARVGRLDADGLAKALAGCGASVVVDAAHPFAEEAHKNAMAAARAAGIPYIRYERESRAYGGLPGVTLVDTYDQAAEVAFQRKGCVMLTTGSKTLALFARRLLGQPDIRMVVRLLPRRDNLEQCEALGIPQQDIVAMQGPFSRELNRAMFQHFGVTLVVTKESGAAGSVDEKVMAALDLGIEAVIIGRPKLEYGTCYSTAEGVLTAVAAAYAERTAPGAPAVPGAQVCTSDSNCDTHRDKG